MSRILTVPQAAEKLQLTPDVVRDYLRTGKLPGRKVGKAWRVVESDLESWISDGKNERTRQFVSSRGLLRKYPGALSSKEVCAEKLEEAELEES
jgi:excisionase family DNA binding protein